MSCPFVLVRAIAISLLLTGSAFGQADGPKAKAERTRELVAMIDALANRSLKSPPQMFKPAVNEERPLFDEPYDVDEQRRVRKALLELNKQVGNDLWRLLLAHADDKRYAYTIEGDYYSESVTVGDLCRRMALGDLMLAYRKHLPEKDDLSNASPERPQSLYPEVSFQGKLFPDGPVKWAEQHPELAMYEVQIVVCEWAVKEAPSINGISDEKKTKFVTDLTKQIATLKESKQPVVETRRFVGETHAVISKKYTESLRNRYENMKKVKK